MTLRLKTTVLLIFVICFSVLAQEHVDLQMIQKIKNEEYTNSKVMETLSYLTDVYGPRLTNSPNYYKAANWAKNELTKIGLENATIEPWGTFGKGWSVESFSLEMTAPDYDRLIAYPEAWTTSTNGIISGKPILLDIKTDEDLAPFKGKLKGAIVMMGGEREVEKRFEADARRYTDEDLAKMEMAPEPGAKSRWASRYAEYMKMRDLRKKISELLKTEGVAVILKPSRGQDGTLFAASGGSYKVGEEGGIASFQVEIENYNRIVRILEKNIPVTIKAELKTTFYDKDTNGHNIIAEIPGTDPELKDQVVMLGGHIDSWQASTGASDNAAGSAVAMEAVRILKALGVQPRRTIRIALWDGEEEGLLGSRGYVLKHFGDLKTIELKPEQSKISGYFNYDNGSGKIRGIYLQGNEAVRPIFEEWLKPFHDMGASTVTIRTTGGTDHLAFDAIGIPGFQFIQDPLDYMVRIHHSNMDNYDHASKSDLMQSAMIMAAFVYNTAMRDEMLPRKPLVKQTSRF
ncbi:MAG: M28 family peptidase [Ignavibacteriaceae bacterium]